MRPLVRTALVLLLAAAFAAPMASAVLNQRTLPGAAFTLPGYYATQRMYTQAGGSVDIHDAIGANEIAILSTIVVAVEYCWTTSTVVTAGAPAPAPYVLVNGADLACTNSLGTHTFAPGCLSFTTGAGTLDSSQPIFLTDVSGAGFCNSLVGNPSICPVPVCGGFVVEVCLSVDLLDAVVGTVTPNEDTDWFFVDGPSTTPADVTWAVSPTSQSNLEANSGTGVC